MAEAERERPPRDLGADADAPLDDIELDDQEHSDLLGVLIQVFPEYEAARLLLEQTGYPTGNLPSWLDAETFWSRVLTQLDRGIMRNGFRLLIMHARRRYQANRTLDRLWRRHVQSTQITEESAMPTTHRGCHIIVSASDEAQRGTAEETLRRVGLAPTEVWATQHAISYAVAREDPAAVRALLNGTRLGWTVVPPGQPDYLLSEIFLQGPDGSRFRVVDAPAQQTIDNLASEVVRHYHGDNATDKQLPTVVDRINAEGERERVEATDTLHDAGMEDGDHLRVAYEARAGAVNPTDRQAALDRVFKQITDFGSNTPAWAMLVNSLTLPTEYEISFDQPGFAPPPAEGLDPVPATSHRVLIALGPDFPETAPHVFWLSPVFHPNVFPTYECEQRRERPDMEGWVCLGILAESWYPAMPFGELLQTLLDIAGYRNYDLFEPAISAEGALAMRPNFVDHRAAQWAFTHQGEIEKLGGNPIVRRPHLEPGYPNVIIALD